MSDINIQVVPERGATARARRKAAARKKAEAALEHCSAGLRAAAAGAGTITPHLIPSEADDPHKVGKREKMPITCWDLLVWAYRDQKVDEYYLWFGKADRLGYGRVTPTAVACERMELGEKIDNSQYRRFPVAPDARRVNRAVREVLGGYGDRMIRCATVFQPVMWQVDLPTARVHALRRKNGKPVLLYREDLLDMGTAPHLLNLKKEPKACAVMCTGYTEAERTRKQQQARADYLEWFGALQAVHKQLSTVVLDRWNLQGLGADKEPWRCRQRAKVA